MLVVAFDGLDYELLQRYDCTFFTQMPEFGRIDNTTGMSVRKTPELFASFLTGTTHEEHGIKGIKKWTNPRIQRFEQWASRYRFFQKFTGLRYSIYESVNRLDATHRKYLREDIQKDTLFDQVPNAECIAVPPYDTSWFWMLGGGGKELDYGARVEEVEANWEKEFQSRKQRLFAAIDDGAQDLLMCHFHKPDIWQHLYAYDNEVRDEDKIRSLYREIERLAQEITERSTGFDHVLFFSDHGLPTDNSHNRNAFYSTNTPIFSGKTPCITEFHDRILDWARSGEVQGVARGVDV